MRANLIRTLTAIGLMSLACVPAVKHLLEAALFTRAAISTSENRALALAPRWEGSFTQYTRGMDSYLNDNFGLRGLGLKINTALKRSLGEGAYSAAYGQDGWLFLNEPHMRQSFMGSGLITPQILSGWRAMTQSLAGQASAVNAPFVVTIVPDKLRIYPEYAPRQYGAPSARRLRSFLLTPQTSGLGPSQIIDIEAGLLAQKPIGLVYARTDTHWTARGAFSAYTDLMGALNAQAKERGRAPWPVLRAGQLTPIEIKNKDTDLRQILGDPAFPLESYVDVQMPLPDPPAVFSKQTRTKADETDIHQTIFLTRGTSEENNGEPAPALQTLVIIGDSFADIAAPFFTHSFQRVVRLHHREGRMLPSAIAVHRPDAVIFMPIERSIPGWHMDAP
jgi:hypothetical protein